MKNIKRKKRRRIERRKHYFFFYIAKVRILEFHIVKCLLLNMINLIVLLIVVNHIFDKFTFTQETGNCLITFN